MMFLNIIKKISLIALMLIATNCRQSVIPTEEDLAGYGGYFMKLVSIKRLENGFMMPLQKIPLTLTVTME